MRYLECGCCGHYHREDYQGDCRNDAERFTLDDLTDMNITNEHIVDLEYQEEI